MKHLQKSFARGILSPNVLTRTNVPGYDEAARELFNIHIGRQGEAYKRGGLAIMARLQDTPVRIIPFKTSEGPFLIAFTGGRITDDSSSDLVNSDSIVIFSAKDWQINKKDVDFSSSDFYSSQTVKVYGRGAEDNIDIWSSYWQDVNVGYTANELKSMDYAQLGNVIVFCGESFPPFIIRKENDNFVFYRNFMDMLVNGDQSENKQKSLEKSIKTLPFNFYGYGVNVYRSRYYGDANYDAFLANLNLRENYDQNGLAQRNLSLWTNRAFIVSTFDETQGQDENAGIRIFGGIIKNIKIISNIEPSQYRVAGFIKSLNGSRNIDFEWTDAKSPNLHLCDWSEELGWPTSVTVFENRFVFGGNAAFPSKIWYSAQPSVQKVQKGTKETVSYATAEGTQTDRVQSRTIQPITQTLYFEQTDFFSIDLSATGLLPLQPATPGNLFINDNLGFKILWVIGGEVLFIGTDIGIFASRGTIVDSSNPVPFNSGFQRPVEVPVKRVFPILIDEALYFISQDNSLQILDPRGERMGFVTQTLDNFSREIIRDVWVRSQITKSLPTQDILPGMNFIGTPTVSELTKAGSIPTLTSIGMVGDVNSGIIFGGHDGNNFLDKYYKYEISETTVTITELTLDSDSISERTLMGMVGDENSGLIFGGYRNINGPQYFRDFKKYEVTGSSVADTNLAQSGDSISNRAAVGMAGNVNSGVIFGGHAGGNNIFNEYYKYEVSGNTVTITELNKIGAAFFGRYGMGLVGDVNSGIIFGGRGSNQRISDNFYKYEISGNTINRTILPVNGDSISARYNMGMVGDVNSGVIFGGYDGVSDSYLNDLYKYEVTGNEITITRINITGDSISTRQTFGMAGNVNNSVIFGGSHFMGGSITQLNDFYRIGEGSGGTGESLTIQSIVNINKTYPVFDSKTRLLFDWSRRTLFLTRENLPYLAMAKNKETGIMGWSRGDMEIQDGVFLSGLPFRPPEIFSSIFGIRGNNIVMLSQGLHSYKENFIDNLPNGIDDFVALNKDSENIDLGVLKDSLKRIGYTDDDLVIVATDEGIIEAKTMVSELSGTLTGVQGNAFIAGKPFGFHLKTWQPLTGRLLGEQFNITQIVYNAIKNSEFLVNDNYVRRKENPHSNAEINGNEFIKQVVQSKLDFDPTLEIKGDSPFPFAISGYVIFIPKGR